MSFLSDLFNKKEQKVLKAVLAVTVALIVLIPLFIIIFSVPSTSSSGSAQTNIFTETGNIGENLVTVDDYYIPDSPLEKEGQEYFYYREAVKRWTEEMFLNLDINIREMLLKGYQNEAEKNIEDFFANIP